MCLVSLGYYLTTTLFVGPSSSRLSRYQQFKDFQRRILVATNLFGRGMDIERVNIVFNYDMPEDSDTYLHRVSPTIIQIFLLSLSGVFSFPKQINRGYNQGLVAGTNFTKTVLWWLFKDTGALLNVETVFTECQQGNVMSNFKK